MQKLAIDLGYGYTKGLSFYKGKEKSVLFPSIVGAGSYRSIAASLGDIGEIRPDNLHIKIKDSSGEAEYFVGELARKESRTANYVFQDNKITHPHTKALLAAATALLTDEDDDILLVTGLPLEYFVTQKAEFLKFLQDFNVELTIYGEEQEIVRNISYKHVDIYPQAAGAAYDAVRRHPSIVKMKGTLLGVIDIGHKTTDYIVFDIGSSLKLVESLSGTINAGISILHSHLDQEYYRQENTHLNPADAEAIILNNGRKLVYGEERDYSEAIRNGVREVAAHIQSAIMTKWDYRLADFPAVYLAGGGAALLKQELQGLHKSVRVLEDFQMSNTYGFMKVAQIIEAKIKNLKAV
ncbi:MAG: hypothetical protein ACOX4N_00365 [Dethiobacteraceae bacterium]|jgi:plasmid segregation protein ParM